jgi:hypothetical protein
MVPQLRGLQIDVIVFTYGFESQPRWHDLRVLELHNRHFPRKPALSDYYSFSKVFLGLCGPRPREMERAH